MRLFTAIKNISCIVKREFYLILVYLIEFQMANISSNDSPLLIENISGYSKIFRAYCQPVFCLIALVGNIGVLVGMARVERGFIASVRLYYSVLAVSELVLVEGYYFTSNFLEMGVSYLVSGGEYMPLLTIDASNWSCKVLSAVWTTSDTESNLILVFLSVERVIAITWPLRAKTILSLRFSVLFMSIVSGIVALSFLPLIFVTDEIVPGAGCIINIPKFPYAQAFTLYAEFLPSLSTSISFVLSVYLSVKIAFVLRARGHLTSGAAKISARELSNVFTVLILDFLHAIGYVPFIIGYMYAFVNNSLNADFPMLVYQIMEIIDTFVMTLHSITFFVYFFRSRDFRVAVLGKRLAC